MIDAADGEIKLWLKHVCCLTYTAVAGHHAEQERLRPERLVQSLEPYLHDHQRSWDISIKGRILCKCESACQVFHQPGEVKDEG